jgi:4'-phosphopantetheinyl transferase
MSGPLPKSPPGPGEVHVWWISLELVPGDALAVLSPGEWARADWFRQPRDRARWTAARAALRLILSGYTGSAPDRLQISPSPIAKGEGGRAVRVGRWVKPALTGGSPLRFSLTHAGDRAALAVAWEREVGLDLEPIDQDLDLPPLMAVACTAAESARLETLPAAERVASFLTLWTLKEAYLKALGSGLSRDPRTISIELLANGHVAAHDSDPETENEPWSLRLLDAGPGWAAALASGGAEPVVREFHWPPRP